MKLSYKPRFPSQTDLKIGIVGAGEIVKFCHLPAYQMANFKVSAICDLDRERAQALADEFGIEHVCDSAQELTALDCVDIIDIATPSNVTPHVVELACKYGKHVLCQKPLAFSVEAALEMSEMLQQSNLKGAVNQQMRYSPSINAAKDAIAQNIIGDLSYAAFHVNVKQPWEEWKFWHSTPEYVMWGHTIHYFDSLRYLLGRSPEFIYTQAAPGVNRDLNGAHIKNYSYLDFGPQLRCQVDVNHDNKCGMDDWRVGFRIEGDRGVINGTNGALHNYPHGRADDIEIFSSSDKQWHRPKLEGRWFPHAFMGTMGELMFAIEQDSEAENSIQNGVETVKMAVAAVKSIQENRPVYLEELPGVAK